MTNTVIHYVQAALDRLGIHYREIPYKNGTLYLCTVPFCGITFDLSCEEDSTIKMWRFVNPSVQDKTRILHEYRKENSALGLEATDEGGISLYAECVFCNNGLNAEKHIFKMIKGYANLITEHRSFLNC